MTAGFQGGPSSMMPRNVSLSDSYKSVGYDFPVWQSFCTEKTMFPFPFFTSQNTIILGGLRGILNCAPIMPRDTSLSDSQYGIFQRDFFLFYTEKTMFVRGKSILQGFLNSTEQFAYNERKWNILLNVKYRRC